MTSIDDRLKPIEGLFSKVSKLRDNRLIIETDLEKFKELVKKIKGSYTSYLTSIVATDFPDKNVFEINYNIWVFDHQTMFSVRVRVPRDNPKLPTIIDIYPGGLPYEQEVYDLLGVVFEGNPHLREHFFKPEDIKGYPLRKDWKGE